MFSLSLGVFEARHRVLGFGILLPPLRRLARHAAPIAAAAAVGELLEHEATRDQFTFKLRLARRARGAVFEFVRRLCIARTVYDQARAPFRRGGANQPDRF